MTPEMELSIVIIEKLLRYGPDVIAGMIVTLGRAPTLDEIKALGITKRPEEFFQPRSTEEDGGVTL
ncbi:MAG: hypothetical protein MIO92_05330 [Methanosarcinaceae archaeon]|nr:hypothetical protein [Methanosarcinaceae archaeon]